MSALAGAPENRSGNGTHIPVSTVGLTRRSEIDGIAIVVMRESALAVTGSLPHVPNLATTCVSHEGELHTSLL